MAGGGVFLSAEWRYLAMVNFAVAPELLEPFVPRGTRLDSHAGRVFLSLVGFRFLDTRVLGVPIPFHRDFDEVNLRFYVRRETGGDIRRGVTFIREVVPRRAIAAVARARYNEPYVALPMRHDVPGVPAESPAGARYEWKGATGWLQLAVCPTGPAAIPAPDSETAFLAEHYWGYTGQRDGGTVEYRVAHPRWRVWPATATISGDMGTFYGRDFGDLLRAPPTSAFLAEGSAVEVHRPVRLAFGSEP